ncbi:unnamed protein product [Candidula unifasciata]|uniref:Innexin n=1 Tax=Candidula unifasciata TaxID=100452 RepID=A0A8S3ZK67_9EUPU|nr:unnamed protein product [Candidula unifasciata]
MPSGIVKALAAITNFAFYRGARDDDCIDRLNHMVMHGLLIFLAIFTGTKQFVGSPIYCWLPTNYDEKYQRKFANNYCWVHTMYNVPFDDPVPVSEESRYYHDVSYYRWSSMMFIFLAALFRIPQLLWKDLKKYSGANIEKLVGMTAETTLMDQDKRDEQLGHVAEFIHRWATTRNMSHRKGKFASIENSVSKFMFCYGKRSGHNLVLIYLFIKFLYLINSISQFFIISRFLKTNYWEFGVNAVRTYAQHGQWENEDVFPRVALCDMKVRALANVYIYTLQCVLGINLFLEKFFFVIWFCLIVIMILNALSFLKWTVQLLHEEKAVGFLTKYMGQLFPKKSLTPTDKKMFLAMARRYLQKDGVFVIRMIADNSTSLLTVDLIRQIWLRYLHFRSEESQKTGGDYSKIDQNDVKLLDRGETKIDDVDK